MGRATHRISHDNGCSTRAYAITPDDTEVYVVLNMVDDRSGHITNIVMNVKDVAARFNAPDVSSNPLVNNLTFGGANPFSPLYWPLISPIGNRYGLITMNAPGEVKPQVRIPHGYFRYAASGMDNRYLPSSDASKLYFDNVRILPTQTGVLPSNKLYIDDNKSLFSVTVNDALKSTYLKSTYKFALQIDDTTYTPSIRALLNYISSVPPESYGYYIDLDIIGPASLPAIQLTGPTKVIIEDIAEYPFVAVERNPVALSLGFLFFESGRYGDSAYSLIVNIQEFPLGASADFTFVTRRDGSSHSLKLVDISLYPETPSLRSAPDGSPEKQLFLFLEALWNNRHILVSDSTESSLNLFNGYFIKVAYLHDYNEFFSDTPPSSLGILCSAGDEDDDLGVVDGDTGGELVFNRPIRETNLFLNGNASDFIPVQWKSDTHSYRVFTKFTSVLRHPWMPLDGSGMKVYDSTGREVSYQMQKDVLVIREGEPPFAVYFNPNPNIVSSLLASYSSGEWSAVQHRDILFGYEPDSYKIAVKIGGYGETDPELAKERRDSSAPLDATPYLQKISGQTVELIVPKNLNQQILRSVVYPIYLEYQDNSGLTFPMSYRYAIETSLEAYQDLLKVRIGTVDPKEFFNVDISSGKGANFPIDALLSEEGWVRYLFRLSGMYGLLSKEPGVRFKPISYWTAAPPDGPGIPIDEVIYRFININLTSVMGEIENLLQANLCTSISRPDGGLHIVPLVPYADKTPEDFANGNVPVLKYCLDANGNYVNDPKLDIGELKVSLDAAFAAVEVEGYSSTVTGNLVKTLATFVQGGRETTVLEIDAGLWEDHANRFPETWNTMKARSKDGNLYFDPPEYVQPGIMDWNVEGFRFAKIDNGVPKRRYYPEVWYRIVGLDSDDPNNLETSTGDANFEFDDVRYLFGLATDYLANAMQLDATYKQLPAEQKNFHPRKILLGFRIHGSASNFCGGVFGDPFFTLKLTVPDIDSATLTIKPLIGKPRDDFAPKWFPNFYRNYIRKNLSAYPRKLKRVENPYVGEMAYPTYAVQASGYEDKYNSPESLVNHLATWLTFLEFLKTRSATIRYAGIAPWKDRQIIGIAVRPPDGSGPPRYMDFYMLDNVEFSYDAGGESWTSATGYYLFRFDLTTKSAIYDPQPDMGT